MDMDNTIIQVITLRMNRLTSRPFVRCPRPLLYRAFLPCLAEQSRGHFFKRFHL